MEKTLYLYRVTHPEHGQAQVEAIDRLRAISRAAGNLGCALDNDCQGVHLRAAGTGPRAGAAKEKSRATAAGKNWRVTQGQL